MGERTDKFSGLPRDFRSVLRPVIESVLMEQPDDIVAFAADYLEDQVKLRDQEWCASGEMNVHGSPVRIRTPSPTKASPEKIEIEPDILIFEMNVKSSPTRKMIHTEGVFSPENVDSSSTCRKTASDSTGSGRNKQRMEGGFDSINASHRTAKNDPQNDQLSCQSKQEFGYTKGSTCKSDQSVEVRALSKDSILKFIGSDRSDHCEQSVAAPLLPEIGDTYFNELLSSDADMLHEVSIETKSELSNEYSEENKNTANILNENENLSQFNAFSLCFDSQQYLPTGYDNVKNISGEIISFEDEQYFNSKLSDEIKQHFERPQENNMVFGEKIQSAQGTERIYVSSANSPSKLLHLHNLDMEFVPRVSECHEGIIDEENKSYCEKLSTVGSPKLTVSLASCQLTQTENAIPEKSLNYHVIDEVIKKLDLEQKEDNEGNMEDQNVGFKDHNIDEIITSSGDIVVPVSEGNNDTFQYISAFANREECDSSASDFSCLSTADEEFPSPLNNDSRTFKSRTMSWEASHVQRCSNWMSRNRGPFNPFQRYGKFVDQAKLPHQYSSQTYESCFGPEEHSGKYPHISLNSVNACCIKHVKSTRKLFENSRSNVSETTGNGFIFYPPPDDVDFIDFSGSAEEINDKESKNTPTITKSQEPLELSRVIFSSDEIEICQKAEGERHDGGETIMFREATREMKPKPSWKNFNFTYAFQNVPFRRKSSSLIRSISMEGDSKNAHYNQESDFGLIQESPHENSFRQSKSLTNVSNEEGEFSDLEVLCKDLSESYSKQSTDQKIIQSHQEEGINLDNEICDDKNSDIEQLVFVEESTNVSRNESKMERNSTSSGIQEIHITECNDSTGQLIEVEERNSSGSKRTASSMENMDRQMQPKEISSESVTESIQENPEKKFQVESGDYDEDYVIIEDFINEKDCKEGTDSSKEADRAASDERTSFDSADSGEGINAFDDTSSKPIPKNLDSQEKMFVGEGGDMAENGIGKHITERLDRLSDPSHVLNHRESGTHIRKRSSDSAINVRNMSESESTSNDDVNAVHSISGYSSDDNCLLNTQLQLSVMMEIFKEQAIETKAKAEESNGQVTATSDSGLFSVGDATVSDTGDANKIPEATCEASDIDNNSNACDITKTGTTSCEEKSVNLNKEKEILNSSGESLRNDKCEDNLHSYDDGHAIENSLSDQGDCSNATSKTETEQLSDTIWPFRDIFKPGKIPSLSPKVSSPKRKCKYCQSPSCSSLESLISIHNDHNEQQKENYEVDHISNDKTRNQSYTSPETKMNLDLDKEAKPERQRENEATPIISETESGASIKLLITGETKDQVIKDSITESSENTQKFSGTEGDCRYAQFFNLENLIDDHNTDSLSSFAECKTTLGETESPKSENTGKGKQE